MMKTIRLFTIFLLVLVVGMYLGSPGAAAAYGPPLEWSRNYGGSRYDEAHSIQATADGAADDGYIIAGWSDSTDGNVNIPGYPNVKAWIVKLKSNSDIDWRWTTDYDPRNNGDGNRASSIQQTLDGGYLFAGRWDSTFTVVDEPPSNANAWVLKLKPNGDFGWEGLYGGSNGEEANSIQQTMDGGYIFAGYSASNDYDMPRHLGSWDYWVVKLKPNRAIEWQRSYGGSSNDEAKSVQQTMDGGYIVAGESFSNDFDVAGDHYGDTSSTDCWVVKLEPTKGDIVWKKSYGGDGADWCGIIQQTTDGGYIFAGDSNSQNGDLQGRFNHGEIDYWVVKLDNTGTLGHPPEIEWQGLYGGSAQDVAYSIQQTANGYIVAGLSNSNDGDSADNHGSNDALVLKLDNQGNMQWNRSYGGSGSEGASTSITGITGGGYVLAGTSRSTDLDLATAGNHGDYDYWVAKLSVPSTPSSPPIADFFGYPITRGFAPLTVHFRDTSENSPTSLSWDFGDGGTSQDDPTPSHTYVTPGIYTVSLTACKGNDCDTATRPNYIIVNPALSPPVANFYATPITRGIAPLTVKFVDRTTNNPTSWEWDFGDMSTTDNNRQNPVHKYLNAGTYTVSLTACNVRGVCDTKTQTDYITVNIPPSVGTLSMHIDPIGDKLVGDKFTITATTNMDVGEEVLCEVYASSYDPYDPYEPVYTGEWSGTVGTVKVAAGSNNLNKISFDVDVSTFKPGTYRVKETAVNQDVRDTTEFNVMMRTITTVPTQTPLPTTTKAALDPVTGLTLALCAFAVGFIIIKRG